MRWIPGYRSRAVVRAIDAPAGRLETLLKAAGRSGLTIQLVTAPVAAGVVEAAQVLSPILT